MVLGDFNADCSYFDEEDKACPLRAAGYTWLIGDGVSMIALMAPPMIA